MKFTQAVLSGAAFFLAPVGGHRARRGGPRYKLRIRKIGPIVTLEMKKLLTLTVTALAMAAFATSTYAGDGCGSGEKKDGDKTEEGTQS